MINDGRGFSTNSYFSGGAGMFVQYHDVIKPAYFYSIIQMMMTKEYHGLPLDMIRNMSILSMTEWYMNRRHKNPLRCLDYANKVDPEELDKLLQDLLLVDEAIHKYAPTLNFVKLLSVYRKQHMSFPIYIYNEYDDPNMRKELKRVFGGIQHKLLFGDLKSAISKCDNNFTYIFSDIELMKNSSEILKGTCSHVLLARDYRYNYIDNFKTFKYNLKKDIMDQYPFIRTSTNIAVNIEDIIISFKNLLSPEGE